MRNTLRRPLIVFQPARKGRRDGKPYRYWKAGLGVCLSCIEQHGTRFFTWSLFEGGLGPFRSFEAAAQSLERDLRQSAKAMGLPSPEEIEAS